MSVLPVLGFMIVLCMLLIINFIIHYKKGTLEKALIVYGKLDPKNNATFKILTKGATFVWPVIQKYYYFYLDDYHLKSCKTYGDINNLEHIISFDLTIRPSLDQSELKITVAKLFGKDKGEIITLLTHRVEQVIRKKISEQVLNKGNLKPILKSLSTKIEAELANLGFTDIILSNVLVDNNKF